MENGIRCVGLGEVLWDVLPTGAKLGGAPANFALHAGQTGLDSMVVSCVGEDERGVEAERLIAEAGIRSLILRSPFKTGYVQVELDDKGVPTYDFAKNTAYDNMPFTDEVREIAEKTKVCCFGTLAQREAEGTSRGTIMSFLRAMPRDSVRVFDVNLRSDFYSPEVIRSSLAESNVFKCNDEELPVLCSILGYEDLTASEFAKKISADFGIYCFIYTCGATGSDIFHKGEHSYVKTPKVEVVDTVGAGDSFTASFVSLTVQGVDFRKAHEFAADYAAYVCTQRGAMPPLSAELKERLDALLGR